MNDVLKVIAGVSLFVSALGFICLLVMQGHRFLSLVTLHVGAISVGALVVSVALAVALSIEERQQGRAN